MAQFPIRRPAVAAVSLTAAVLLTIPPIAMADEGAPDGSGATTDGPEDTAVTSPGGAETTATTPATGPPVASDPISEAIGSLVKSFFGNGRTGSPTPTGSNLVVAANTAPVEPVESATGEPPAEADLAASAEPAIETAPEAFAVAAADPAPPQRDPWTDFMSWWRGCTCDHEVEPPPPPPPPPDDEEEGWGIPIGFPGVPRIKTNKKGCGPYVPGLAVPPAPPGVVPPPVVPPVVVPPGGGGGAPLVGGGGAPVALAGGAPAAPVFVPASYDEGLTFLTGVDEGDQPSALPIVVTSIIVSVGGGYILWRRNAERPTGRHRRNGTSDRCIGGGVYG